MAGDVMIPVDGTPASARALSTALRVARLLGAGLLVVRVFDVSYDTLTTRAGMLGAPEAGEALRADMTRELEQIAERARAAGVPARVELLEGDDVAVTLLAHARRVGVAAIVLLTSTKGALARAVLGSVSDRVMREAGLPVVLVPPSTGDGPAAEAVAAERPLHQVLVPVNGSTGSEAILERLLALPRRHELVLTLFRAIDRGALTGVALPERSDGGASLDAHLHAEHDALEALARRLTGDGISAHALTVESSHPADAITAAARDTGADLIAMITRGSKGVTRLARGSTADAVVRRATVPVLLVAAARA